MYNIVNLSEYINSWRILENIENNWFYDIVFFETKRYILDEFVNRKWSFKLYFLEDLAFDWGLSAVLEGLENKKILFVLNEYNSFYLLPILSLKVKKFKKFHILNTNIGISSLVYKNIPELYDITNMLEFLNIYEPIDFQDLINLFWKEENLYARVANKDYAIDIFNGEKRDLDEIGLLDLTSFNLSGQNGTIVVWWSVLSNLLQAIDVLQNQWYFFDVFVVRNYNFQLDENFKDSLRNTERLIFIWDVKGKGIVNLMKSKVYESGIYDLIIDFIFPKYEKVDTTLSDYLYERAEFDYKSLANRVINLLS